MTRRVLIANEIDGGRRLLDRVLAVAQALSGAGWDVTLGLRQPEPLAEPARQRGWRTLTAPAWRAEAPPGFIASSYADLLLNFGFLTQDSLRDIVTGWRRVLEQERPDLVIADFAPAMLLAARLSGVKVACLGDGYTVPPRVAPFPNMRLYADPPPTHMAVSDGRALASANAVLTAAGGAPLPQLADMLAVPETFLCTFPELDHYPDRGDGAYYGEVFLPETGVAPDWPAGPAERILVRLSARHGAFNALLDALAGLGLPSVVHARDLDAERAAALSRPGVRVITGPLDRAAALQACDFVVCDGLADGVPALLASRPLLVFPVAVEQMMALYRLNHQGLAHGLPPDSDVAAIAGGLRRLLDDAPCRRGVANFARAYTGYSPALATRAIVEACDGLAG